MKVYYEYEPTIGVNVTYDQDGQRHHDYFKTLYTFKIWASAEFFGAELIEITDSNYQQLTKEGKI